MRVIRASSSRFIPSFVKESQMNCTISESSRGKIPRSRLKIVTSEPSLLKACASSEPIGPPPITARCLGCLRSCQRLSECENETSSNPGVGGIKGRAPVATTMFFVVKTRPLTSTSCGERIVASLM